MSVKTGEFKKIKRKSPLLAGLLSAVIPGTGQFYNGRIKDGILALITNGLFIWGTYEAYRRDYYQIGIIVSVFSLGWYAGNVYGAVNGSHRYNYLKEEKFISGLKKYENIRPAEYR
jgi:TM2 domain-containing membrane protein YozV